MADAGKIVITPKGVYSSTKTYEWLDEVSYNGNAYVALKTVTGVTPSDDGVNWRLFMSSTDVDANVLVPKFTEASTRSNIVSGENLSTMFGKIKKWFTDLKSHAFKDLVNNLTTETTGSALDASQGKVLQEELDGVNRNLTSLKISEKSLTNNIIGTDTRIYYYPLKIGDVIKVSKKNDSDSFPPISSDANLKLIQCDENGTIIDHWQLTDGLLPRKITIAKESNYVKWSYDISDRPLMVNTGETVLPYEPYIPSNKMLAADVATLKKDLGEQKKIYSETTINVGRQAGTTIGDNSTAEGLDTEASGASSHSEGWLTTASNDCSHAEGNQTGASGIASHSEGTATGASGDYSHAEGDTTTASGESSHAEGINTTSNGISSHAEGKSTNNAFDYVNEKTSTSDIQTAWASNKFSIAKGESAHVEGEDCLALGDYSHAEGRCTIANGNFAHSEGYYTQAERHSHASGFYTISLTNQFAIGHSNNTETALENSIYGSGNGTAFVIGNGASPSNRDNAFRVTSDGYTYAKNSYTTSGADYAEYFEWSDENPDSEDRVGYFVTLDEDNPEKIRIANNGDYILGIVSGMPSVIGNGDECWKQRYILDEFGRYIVEEFEYEVVVGVDEETGKEIKETKIGTKWKENPDYDSTKPYIPRKERAEWSAIGMVGVLSVYDDGSCKVNGYCKVADGGIATEAEKGDGTYRVIKRVNENIVKIVLK